MLRTRNEDKLFVGCWLLWAAGTLVLTGAIGYTIFHFVAKLW